MTPAELRELARTFLYPGDVGDDDPIGQVHVGEGALAATDGRIIFQAWDPGLHHEDGDGSHAMFLDFDVCDTQHFAGSPAWCFGELKEVAERGLSAAIARAVAALEDYRLYLLPSMADARRVCPCCGEELFEVDGELATSFPETPAPNPRAELRYHGGKHPLRIYAAPGKSLLTNPVYLAMALDAAEKLGGCGGLWIGQYFQLRGAPGGMRWRICWMPMRDDGDKADEPQVRCAANGDDERS